MTSLDFSPAPGPAPARQRVLSHARIEAALLIRNGEQLLLALVIPIGVLVAGRLLGRRLGWSLDQVAPSVLGLAVWSTAFTSVAITTAFERRYGVLERLAATPLGRGGLLAGKAVAITALASAQVMLLGLVAVGLGWRPQPTWLGTLAALTTVGIAGTAFVALALNLASGLRAEATLAMANVVYLIGAVLGLLVPASAWPSWARGFVLLTPTSALGEALRSWSSGGQSWWPILIAAVWALLWSIRAVRRMSWLS